jgi:hypothetical protein
MQGLCVQNIFAKIQKVFGIVGGYEMKIIVKDLLKRTVMSIAIAMAIFCFVGIVFDMGNGGKFSLEGYQFTKMVVGCALVGLGFGVPSVIYNKENLPMPIKVIVHMGIGCIVYTIVAYSIGWIGTSVSLLQGIIIVAIQLSVAFLIWFLFMRYYRKEAKILNDKIQELKE